jgi:hypothetical protein
VVDREAEQEQGRARARAMDLAMARAVAPATVREPGMDPVADRADLDRAAEPDRADSDSVALEREPAAAQRDSRAESANCRKPNCRAC